MTFWDSSAIVPLLVREWTSARFEALLKEDPFILAWWAADALPLAAAILAAQGQPATLGFVCFDERLAAAARKEGFEIVGL